jgi:hypothetical protein
MFIAISRLLWAFKMTQSCDEAGVLVPLERDALTQGMMVQPLPYT